MSASKVVGLDIGTGHVRAVEIAPGRSGSTPTVTRVAERALPPGAVRDGEVAEPHTVATAIKEMWAANKLATDVVLGVGNQRVIVRDLEMPAMTRAQIKTALPFQVGELLPVNVDDALLDFLPLTERDGGEEQGPIFSGLLVAATKDTVMANIRSVQMAKLNPVAVDLSAFALARALTKGEAASQVVALVDVGARVTTVIVLDHGIPRLVRLVAAGGQDVTDTLSDTLSISAGESETLKRQVGFGQGSTPQTAAAAEAIGAVTRVVIESIRNTFVYYGASNPGNGVGAVVLTGGGCSLPGFGQYLSNASRLPISVGQPFAGLTVSGRSGLTPPMLARQHEFAVAAGLALRSAA